MDRVALLDKISSAGLVADTRLLDAVEDGGFRCLCNSLVRCPCAAGIRDAQEKGECACGLLSKGGGLEAS